MANKYSKYELKPFTSTYVDPKWAEATTNYKATYDKNMAKKDEIDQALGGLETLDGDAHIVEKAKNDVRGQLDGVVKSGAYEDASSVISETMNNLHGHKGIKASQKSYKNRQDELEFIKKARMEGKTILDFGKSNVNTHSSYVLNKETGKYETNIYESSSQPKLHYEEKMQSLFKGFKSNTWGINASDVNKTVEMMLPAYLTSDEGKQDVRNLMELEYDQSIPENIRMEMARKDIKDRMTGVASIHIHELTAKASDADKKKQKKYEEEQNILFDQFTGNSPQTVNNATSISTSKTANTEDIAHSVMSVPVNEAIAEVDYVMAGNESALKDMMESKRRVLDKLIAEDLATPRQVQEYKFYNDQIFKHLNSVEGYSTKKTTALKAAIKYMTSNMNLSDFTMGEEYVKDATERVTTVVPRVMGSSILGMPVAQAVSWAISKPGGAQLVWGLAAGMSAAYAASNYFGAGVMSIADTKGNVRDTVSPQKSDQFASKYLGVSSEQAKLASNLSKIDWLNRTLDLKGDDRFVEEDVFEMKRVGASYLTYMQESGDAFDEILGENNGGAVDYDVIAPDVMEDDGAQAMTRINTLLKTTTLSNFRVVGAPEGSPEYDDLSKDGHNISGYMYKGLMAPSLVYDTPLRLSFYRDGSEKHAAKEFLAETKNVYGKDSEGKKELSTAIAAATGRLDYVVLSDTQKKLQGVNDLTMADATKSIGESVSTVAGQVGLDPSLRLQVWKDAVRGMIIEHPDARKVINKLGADLLKVFSGAPQYASAAKTGNPLKVTDLTKEDKKMYYEHMENSMFGELDEETGQFSGGIAQSTKYLIR